MTNYVSMLFFFLLLIPGAIIAIATAAAAGPGWAVLVGISWFVFDIILANGIQLAAQWERGVIFRLGKFSQTKGPGLFIIIPIVDQVTMVDTRIRAMDIPAQQVITRDN